MATLIVAVLLTTTPTRAALPPSAKHAQDVLRFFDSHRAAGRSPAGQRALWRAIHTLNETVRSLQAARDALPVSWLDATRYVGRYYGDGIAAWERSCSATEGGWGAWEWYENLSYPRYGSVTTPGGWMQFMGGTFWGIIDEAIADARSRGMLAPDSARSYFSPLGQAIAAARMILDGRRGEWTGSGC